MTCPANKIVSPASDWTSVRPDPVPIMMGLQTSSHKPASRILAEAFLWSWRPRNFAASAVDTDLSMKNYHQNFRPGVKQTSQLRHSFSFCCRQRLPPSPMILSRSKINKIFSTRTGIMSNKKFYGFCRPSLKESSQEIIHSQDVWSSLISVCWT